MPFLQKCAKQFVHFCCRAPHGARGLKFGEEIRESEYDPGRAPHGARGLKCRRVSCCGFSILPSRPAWGAWIEIPCVESSIGKTIFCRAPHGARGLKSLPSSSSLPSVRCRAPHGARGLKYFQRAGKPSPFRQSRPAWGAWIEISIPFSMVNAIEVAPRMGRVD